MKPKRIVTILATALMATMAWAQGDGGTENGGLLTGTLKSQRLTGGVAVLRNGANGLGFYSVNASTTIAANTAYAPQARNILIDMSSLDNVGTAIDGVQRASSGTRSVYDLQGRRQQDGKHGLYIVRHTDGRSEKVIR